MTMTDQIARRSKADQVDKLRRVSRQEYLKKWELKKLEELRADIEDEEFLFGGVKLSEEEKRELRYKKRIYQIASKKRIDCLDGYRMPDAYDGEGGVNQERRFSVALQRQREDRCVAQEKTWEQHQSSRATLTFGSANLKPKKDGYDYVFEDQMEFVRKSVMDGANVEQESPSSTDTSLENDRMALPIYPFRDDLLRAIDDHQVLVVVGETGSGKTTQIPQFLHEAGYTRRGIIGCTQPRRVAAMSVAARVSREMGVKLGHEVGYSIRFEDRTSEKTVLKYMTDGMLLREFRTEPNLGSYSVVMVDEAHERSLSTETLFGLVKDISRHRPDLKLIISSATLDAEKFSKFFDYAPIYKIPGRRYPVEIHYTKAPVSDYVDAAVVTALQIHVTQPPGDGDVLVFLTGKEEIEAAEEMIRHRTRGLGTKVAELIICSIYANLPSELQAKIFEPTPEGARKIVLATNIAEASLTIDGIKYVVDPGLAKMKFYNPTTGMELLKVAPISKASADQRAGRSGRTGPGKCFRLYTDYEDLEDTTEPEIQRTNLASVVLTLKSLAGIDPATFDYMDPPSRDALAKALELLYALNAINKCGQLTKLGRMMAEFPLDPMLSKMIVASEKYKCSEEIISIAAMLSVGNAIFYRPKDKHRVNADSARSNFHAGNVGDHVALLRVYNSWKETDYSTRWCHENYVQARSLKRARDIREQLEGLLERVGIELSSSIDNLDAIKKAIASGFFPNAAKLRKHGSYRTLKHSQAVYIHPSSGLAESLPRWVVYHELVLTTKEYVRQVTEIKPEWLVEIAPHYYQSKDVEDPSSRKMPRGVGRALKD